MHEDPRRQEGMQKFKIMIDDTKVGQKSAESVKSDKFAKYII